MAYFRAMLRSKQPNRFFGVNPQGMPSQGRREGAWSRDVPKDWRTALGLGADAPGVENEGAGEPDDASDVADTADAESEGATA